MLTHQIRDNIAYFLRSQDRFAPFLGAVVELARYASLTLELLQGIAVGGNGLATSAGQIHATVAQLTSVLKGINHNKFFLAKRDFVDELEDIWAIGAPDEPVQIPEWVADLTQRIDELTEVYNLYLSEQSGGNALPVLLAAQDLQIRFETSVLLLNAMLMTMGSQEEPAEGEAAFSLYLPEKMNLREVIARLNSVQSMYSTICGLLNVSEEEHPMRPIEIESGSLWAKFFGESKVIGLLTTLVKEGVSFVYRNYTTEGKLSAIPKQIESIESLLNFTQKLKELGVEVQGAEEKIQQATLQLSEQCAALVYGQTSVTVNQHQITLEEEMRKQQKEEFAKTPNLMWNRLKSSSTLTRPAQLPPLESPDS